MCTFWCDNAVLESAGKCCANEKERGSELLSLRIENRRRRGSSRLNEKVLIVDSGSAYLCILR